jgi:hypothetical protein
MKSPSLVKALTVAAAPPYSSEVGRMIETGGNFRLRNGHGSGMTKLVWNCSPPNGAALRFGNTSWGLFGSVRGARGSETALPALSCPTRKP